MLTILLHSSKTMRPSEKTTETYQRPQLQDMANTLGAYLRTLTSSDLEKHMKLSRAKAEQTHALLQEWTDDPATCRPAIDAFLGDIYSGLQVQSFTGSDRDFANDHLLILSGLYGGLRALDSISPYRLEMGYKFPDDTFANLYTFWGTKIAGFIPPSHDIVNLSAVEYTKSVLPHIKNTVITPKFLTRNKKTGEATFVTVHAKIARGAFAHWMITNRIDSLDELAGFNELGYAYDAASSTPEQPIFICDEFKGIGLSVRLT